MQTLTRKSYTALLQGQRQIARAVCDLSLKLRVLGTLADFDRVTKRGRGFASRHRITKKMALQDD